MQDIFGTMKFQGTSYGEGFRSVFKFQREPRVIQLTLSYKLNNFKNKVAREENSSQGNDSGNTGEF